MSQQTIRTASSITIIAHLEAGDGLSRLIISADTSESCVLHWGLLCRRSGSTWRLPPIKHCPPGSAPVHDTAVQTPLAPGEIRIGLPANMQAEQLVFVLYFPDRQAWDNNSGRNYLIDITPPAAQSPPLLQQLGERETGDTILQQEYRLQDDGILALRAKKTDTHLTLLLATDIGGDPSLHWGFADSTRSRWQAPPAALLPPGSRAVDRHAAQTPFQAADGAAWLTIALPLEALPRGIAFVLHRTEPASWFKNRGKDFFISLRQAEPGAPLDSEALNAIADEIIACETGRNSWTLMHRYNLCCDLLEDAGRSADALALLYVWLRYSQIRQLDWQRNYNTKPRELSHALDRLTLRLTELYLPDAPENTWIRLMLSTLGRGGEGQRVRDEILEIMHRHHIKEVAGHFIEQWHQKLHNNTTPDDIVICEAYLAFLASDGDQEAFYRSLKEGGITQKRLAAYERPITEAPVFPGHLKDALLHDFGHFLTTLKRVHDGTDLGTAIDAARPHLDGGIQHEADYIRQYAADRQLAPAKMVAPVTALRHHLAERFAETGPAARRDLLFLDLALEQHTRIVIERHLHRIEAEAEIFKLTALVLDGMCIGSRLPGLHDCLHHWRRLRDTRFPPHTLALHKFSVIERLERLLAALMDGWHECLQPKAELLGKAFQAEPWTIEIFSEEVGRGQINFALAALIKRYRPLLRTQAGLGDWQIISRQQAVGRISVIDSLQSIQGKPFDLPTVIITDRISGDEDIPPGVTAVITPDTTDIVSHVAIRARNARALLATCYSSEVLATLRGKAGSNVAITIAPDGSLTVTDHAAAFTSQMQPHGQQLSFTPVTPTTGPYAVCMDDFSELTVGGKARNLKSLRGLLPEWIDTPSSAAIPYAVFDQVLARPENRKTADAYQRLIQKLSKSAAPKAAALLGQLRSTVLELSIPDELQAALQDACRQTGLPQPAAWPAAHECIKKVWASKWNDRAYYSRCAVGIPHDDVYMSVLIQEIVPADYSFVIHTENPFSGNRDELYAELVAGLGETLVGNYPGLALGFTWCKKSGTARLLTVPNKHSALYGQGLIFRSDSSAEDLPEYAGAGLYDSVMLPEPDSRPVAYADLPMLWDAGLQQRTLEAIARIGCEIEQIMGGPQDIEGALPQDRFVVVQTRPQVG